MKLKKTAVDAVHKVEDVVSDVHPVKQAKRLSRFVPKAVTLKHGRAVLKVQKHSPAILFGVGLVAGVATVVTACQATLKLEGVLMDAQLDIENAKDVLRDHSDRYSVKDYNKDIAILRVRHLVRLGRLYALPAGLGVISVGALTGSHHILSTRNAAVTAAYAAVEKGFAEYRERVVTELGEEREREIHHGVEERTIVEDTKNGPVKKTIRTHGESTSPYARVYDEVTARNWKPNPMTNRMYIQCQQNWANDLLQTRGYVFLNEVHDMLGLEITKAGQQVGWALGNGDDYIDFGLGLGKSDEAKYEFMLGQEASVLLDFNVDGNVLDLI